MKSLAPRRAACIAAAGFLFPLASFVMHSSAPSVRATPNLLPLSPRLVVGGTWEVAEWAAVVPQDVFPPPPEPEPESTQPAPISVGATQPPASSVPAPPPRAWDGTLHGQPFLICTRRIESDSGDANGNGLHDAGYQAIGGGGTFRGAFQFMRSTWDSTAAMAGRPDLIGVDPAEASVGDQDTLAWALYQASGNGPWGGRC